MTNFIKKLLEILFFCIISFIAGVVIGRKNSYKKQVQIHEEKVKTIASEVKSIDLIKNNEKVVVKTIYRTVYRKDGGVQSRTKEVEDSRSNTVLNQKLDDRLYRKEQREEKSKNELIVKNENRFVIGLLIDPTQKSLEKFSIPLSYKITNNIMVSSEFDWDVTRKDSIIPFYNGFKIGLQCECF